MVFFNCFRHHSFDIVLGQSTLIVGDGDLLSLTSTLLKCRHVQDTVGIDIESDFDLWNTSWSWWDTGQFKLTQDIVVFGLGSFTFKNLDQDTRLVVSIGGESLRLLVLGLSVGGVTSDNGSLDSGTVGNSFIRVDGLVWLFATKEFRNQLLNLWNSSGTTNQDDFINLGLVNLGVSQDSFNWV
ncbi:hypothetical protein WICPIJ_009358 [Wickerhamomyces pijperi]|uniref:Uncharacterized protein n=1 Tax=Wickerhamomyces pijperi TaxID=599730 RepID=A0A9P8PPZ0_WICPI|nr:hypothetical protein WICPIJ_009358 [Wickerhamomyces pijperi]